MPEDPVQEDTTQTSPPAVSEPSPDDPAQELCTGECASYRDGHRMHPIRARHTGEQPWGWRDAVVETVDGPRTTVRYLVHDDSAPQLWHHHDLADWVRPRDPVRLHERCRVLGTGRGWLTVTVDDGLGPVPDPADPGLRHAETSPGIVDLAHGTALPTDRPD